MMSVWGKNLFTGEDINDEESWIKYLTTMIGSVKNQLEHELDRPVSFREAMVEMKLEQKIIDGLSANSETNKENWKESQVDKFKIEQNTS